MHNRFYCPKKNITKKQILITDKKQIHHFVNVLRFSIADKLVIFDGEGKDYDGSIQSIKKEEITIVIEKESAIKRSQILITLACAIPKRSKFDFVVEKCTELGADKIIPMKTNRIEVSLSRDRMLSKVNHWRQIAISASEQSHRSFVPKIDELRTFEELCLEIKKYDLAILPAISEKKANMQDVLKGFNGKKVIVFIGPEGDFTKDEIKQAQSLGAKLVTLGPRVLKVDTAAIHSVSILNHILKSN